MPDIDGPHEHLDVLVVGAGISGIGAAYHLRTQCPDKRFAVLEALDSFGGTWWMHRYPGVRSDSDLFTFGYRFKPWRGNPLATAEEILTYLREVIDENDLAPHIRYQHRITGLSWSTDHRRWSVTVERQDTNEVLTVTAGFVWMCQGYYRHAEGYTPEWEGVADFGGQVVHPQTWPDDIELAGKRVVVIGSGATAATLIPAIADDCEHVTMLQRSPTFFFVRPKNNELADTLRSLDIPDEWTHEIMRRKMLQDQEAIAKLAEEAPDLVRAGLLEQIRPLLPEGFDVDKHFNPSYRPWQQRIAVLPEGDLFRAIRLGKASVVTDQIERFTEDGIQLRSGEQLRADVIITATGFELSPLGDIPVTVDGEVIDPADTVTYRGIMFTDMPNMAYVFGYFRASWTLRADLIADFVCRLLRHMDDRGATMVVPAIRDDERSMTLRPWVDPENFNPGYLTRSLHRMPKQGAHDPWQLHHEYSYERAVLASADLDDGALQFK